MHSFAYLSLLLSSSPLSLALVAPRSAPAPYLEAKQPIKNEYIVGLQKNYTLERHFEHVGRDLFTSGNIVRSISQLNVYTVRGDADLIHNNIRRDPGVEFVHDNYLIHEPEHADAGPSYAETPTKSNRLARRWKTSSGKLNYNEAMIWKWGKQNTPVWDKIDTTWLDDAGRGTLVYVFDTGIRQDHNWWKSGNYGGPMANFRKQPYCDGDANRFDDTSNYRDGHGTAVAGVVKRVAWGATIVNVKVVCPGGTSADRVAQSIVDVTDEHNLYKNSWWNRPSGWKGGIINMSFSAQESDGMVARAIEGALAAGLPVITSSGNNDLADATYPCGLPKVQCVSSVNRNYDRAVKANWGSNVTIAAPGARIYTASKADYNRVATRDGTSFAAPHVAGIMAIFISTESINSDIDLAITRLQQNTIEGALGNGFDGTVNKFANTGLGHPNRNQNFPYFGPDANSISSLSNMDQGTMHNPFYDDQPEEVVQEGPENAEPNDDPDADDDKGHNLAPASRAKH